MPTPALDAVYEDLADNIEGWAGALGTDAAYFDPLLEEGGASPWARQLRRSCDWSLRTARTMLASEGRFGEAEDLKRRMDELFDSADAYQQRLEAAEDHRRVRAEGITAQYRESFGVDDPDGFRLDGLRQGIQRVWTLGLDEQSPRTPEAFAEAIDRAAFEEAGTKGRAKARIKRRACELVEHLRLLMSLNADQTGGASGTGQTVLSISHRPPDSGEAEVEESFGLPEPDPHDAKAVRWMGKRLYLGKEGSQVRSLFMLLASRPGVARTLDEVQLAVDQMGTDREEHGEEDFKKAQNRIAKALSKLRGYLREHHLDDHILIVKDGPRDSPSYTLIARFGR